MNQKFSNQLLREAPDNLTISEMIEGVSIEEKLIRFSVYRNNIHHSLTEALADIFPICQQVVGEAFFAVMAKEFIRKHPPKSAILTEYGKDFSDFIVSFTPAQSVPYLSELASLERILLTLTHGRDYPIKSQSTIQQALTTCSVEQAVYLNLLPNTQLLAAHYSVGSVWLHHQDNKTHQLSELDFNQGEYLLLFKSGLQAELKIISLPQAHFIKALLQKKSILEAREVAGNNLDLAITIALLLQTKIITKVLES